MRLKGQCLFPCHGVTRFYGYFFWNILGDREFEGICCKLNLNNVYLGRCYEGNEDRKESDNVRNHHLETGSIRGLTPRPQRITRKRVSWLFMTFECSRQSSQFKLRHTMSRRWITWCFVEDRVGLLQRFYERFLWRLV